MKVAVLLGRVLAVLVLVGPLRGQEHTPDRRVTAVAQADRERLGLAEFYQQWVDAGGLVIASSRQTSPYALLEAAYIVDRMLAGREDLRAAIAGSGTRLAVMSYTELTTEVPEHSDLKPSRYWDRRARGLGATRIRPAVSCGEENLLGYPGDPYSTEQILVHEFAHVIHQMGLQRVDATFDERLRKTHEAALAAGLWRGTYAGSNHNEYWAEAVQSWFDTNRQDDSEHNHVNTRAELEEYDPAVAALLREAFGDNDWRYHRPADRKEGAPHLEGYDAKAAPTFAWPPELDAWYRQYQKEQAAARQREDESELEWKQRIAAAGDASAQVHMGWCHREGKGVEADDVVAVGWYRRAADQGHPGGLDSLGWMLAEGRGIERDDSAAVNLFRRSAALGHAQGQYNLGRMMAAGRGTPADAERASMWLGIASSRGNDGASRLLAEVAGTIGEEPATRAAALAQAWQPPHPRRLRVLTYNIHHGAGTDGVLDLARLARIIEEASPDVVALQEVDQGTKRTGGVDQAAELGRLTGYEAHFGLAMDYQGGGYGEAILTRTPVASVTTHALPFTPGREPRAALGAHLLEQDVLILATHLDHLKDATDRIAQATRILEVVAEVEASTTIVTGDLNATPESRPIEILRAVFTVADAGGSLTYPAGEPERKIDYVMTRPDDPWQVVETRVIDERVASDHRPLLVVLERR